MERLNTRLRHLAQEHQTVMQFVSTLRKGNLETGVDLPGLVGQLQEVYARQLAPHLDEEEKNALPLLRETGHAALADKILAQHDEIRSAIEALGKAPTTEGIVTFVRLLEQHIEFEDGQVWGVLE